MIIKARYYLLIAGFVTVMVSFLFFGRKHEVYNILIGSGAIISCVSFLWILLGNDSFKRKLFWTGVVLVCGVINLALEPLLINGSFRIYLAQHEQELTSLNNILRNKHGEILITRDSVITKEDSISVPDRTYLLKARKEVNAYMVHRDHNIIYYGLWGFLDVRIGITYSLNGEKLNDQYHHLTGSWYR